MNGAQERTRTSTPLRELAPEASASANSATWAQGAAKRGRIMMPLLAQICQLKDAARKIHGGADFESWSNSYRLRVSGV
jgi:hypothetical protein